MPETFAQYLEKWLKQSTAQGLNNPLVKMPVKRFRIIQPNEFESIKNGGSLLVGTMSDPIARNLFKNFQTRIRERGEHCAFICYGAVEMVIAGDAGREQRKALFPVCLKRTSLQIAGDKIRATVLDDERWQFNPILKVRLQSDFGINVGVDFPDNPERATAWLQAQLGNRVSLISADSYIGLFSSQHMVVQQRLTESPLRQTLARNPVIRAKIEGIKVDAVECGEITDDGLENLGIVLPCDDSQLQVVQLSNHGFCLQVEGPPGTGKSQTIANIVSNALYQGRKVMLVCDKKAAIVQVEERLTNCGLKPAILNLHDEDLDKREFLKQATDKFQTDRFAPGRANPASYPFEQLRETRKTLNERVKFGRSIVHPSLQVTKRHALAGMIQLKKQLTNVPNIAIANWQSLSKERLTKLLSSLAEWPGLSDIINNSTNIWNNVHTEAFDNNPNAGNELQALIKKIFDHFETLDELKEWMAILGIEMSLETDVNVMSVLNLVEAVIRRPRCHPQIIGNPEVTFSELNILKNVWEQRMTLDAANYPVPLTEIYSNDAENTARTLVINERAVSWRELSQQEEHYNDILIKLNEIQDKYLHLCKYVGLVCSPLLKVRRAQLQALLGLGKFGGLIPRAWWDTSTKPVMIVDGWLGKLRTCISQTKTSPLPLHLITLERIAPTHWKHVEAMAEHGFNMLSYCLKFIDDRKCKFALRQAYPSIPVRGFKQWREVTLHAVTAYDTTKSLRNAAEPHVVLKHITENYLSVAHEIGDDVNQFIEHEDIRRLQNAAALVEQCRDRNDLYEVNSIHWQTFWESPNPSIMSQIVNILAKFDSLSLPDNNSDNIENAIDFYDQSRQRIRDFLHSYEKKTGDRAHSILRSFAAQKEYENCKENLAPLDKYLELQDDKQRPDWQWLKDVIEWRDLFERLRDAQKLDIDSILWPKLRDRLREHSTFMEDAYKRLDYFFDHCRIDVENYTSLMVLLEQISVELPRLPLWIEKKKWDKKIPAFPELKELWGKVLEGNVVPAHAERLFCFNLLRLCDPIAKPQGPELKQTLNSFVQQDENLTTWILDHLKTKLRETMRIAASAAAQSESRLRQLSGMQRVRGTVRELVNAHLDYLRSAKPCWMMSPTSLANLVDSSIFEKYGVPFDMIIFDEASQIRVLDGLLSMAFGKQVIIVGDKNQLPPTDFFASFANDDEVDTQDFGISESLLDEFSGVFSDDNTHVMLMSHYRSETPDLIRFSNDWFYSGRLEMYPPAHISGIGRRLHYVSDAVYSETAGQRNNPVEANEVVKLIELHVRECPEKSLGVVTMNIPQMELIDERLQFFQSDAVRAFCSDDSKFFLRNLETVQGDEMDRIILSLTYGKNASGKFNASVLGPLTKSGGERRLNVAITRSRSGLTVVSSLKPSDLETANAQSRGFQCLKALLRDLEVTAQHSRNFGLGNKRFEKRKDGISNVVYCDSPFEEQVVEFLENEGYEIECQYGAGKFRLDIVVKERGKYLLAIECDGAAYHSSLVARTRDRARQRLLEKLGWRFHRVWSTNWWFFEQQEKESIIAAINAARFQTQIR
jgi:very-short-patch-repair endonuclease